MLFPVLRDHRFHCRSVQTCRFSPRASNFHLFTHRPPSQKRKDKSVQLFHAARNNVWLCFTPPLGITHQVSAPTYSRWVVVGKASCCAQWLTLHRRERGFDKCGGGRGCMLCCLHVLPVFSKMTVDDRNRNTLNNISLKYAETVKSYTPWSEVLNRVAFNILMQSLVIVANKCCSVYSSN